MAKNDDDTELARMTAAFGDLPETFVHRNGDGTISQIKDPCYNLLSPGFYGDTWYDEGEVIATFVCPNHEMQPLNRAAARRMMKWLDSLPAEKAPITIEDMTEAAFMLAKDPEYGARSHQERCLAAQKLAVELKARRDRVLNGGVELPNLPGTALRAAKSSAPAMPNIKIADANVRGPGASGQTILHDPSRRGGAPGASRVTPALGLPVGAPAGAAVLGR
jgi:hypothetical protein